MTSSMSQNVLRLENLAFEGTGGRSQENAGAGFRPAFLDRDTREVFPSRYADGRLAPLHLLDGLPDNVVVKRAPGGQVQAVKASIVSGFTLDGEFYTREAAAQRVHSFELC
jgi:hypothetical protein